MWEVVVKILEENELGWTRRCRIGAVVALMCAVSLAISCDRNNSREDRGAVARGLDGHARLSSAVVPKAYDLFLAIDPDRDAFDGEVVIDVEISAESERLVLHAEELAISKATILPSNIEGKAEPTPAAIQLGENGAVALAPKRALAPGAYTITLAFSGKLDEVPTGLYRVKEKDHWYAFTQFEPLEARQAFPCFDEPRFKTPFTVEISSPEKFFVAANGPLKEKTKDADRKGWVRHNFTVTRPLPTYLVAMTVGEFDVVEAPADAIPDVPLRILAPKGQGPLAKYALEKTPEILAILTDYFGQPYPFAKLDMVAVPNFSAGAMENVGLVTFRESLLLMEEATATPSSKYSMLSVTAHELAHMWFGNLVTPGWWDDLWLNESFATWMASRTLEELDPSLEAGVRALRSTSWVMGADSLAQTRAMRQPIEHGGDVYNAFDGITYTKGAAVLRMTEAWLGEEKFREGVRAFMKENAYGTVTTPALMKSLEAASDKPVYEMMKTFIDQPGAPLLEVTPLCAGSASQVRIKQSRYLPAGSRAAKTGPWFVPVCVKYGRGDEVFTQCLELRQEEEVISLPGACPDWIHPNANEAGYYRWSLPEDQMLALAGEHRARLTLREQLGLMGNLDALVDAEAIEPVTNIDVATSLLAETNDHIVQEAAEVLAQMKRVAVRQGLQQEYAAFLRANLGPHLERLGLDPAEGESPVRARLRRYLLGFLGDEGKDVYVMSNAKSLVPAFLEDPDSISPYRARWAISLAATEGDKLLWEALLEALPKADQPGSRGAVIGALGSFGDPVLIERSLDLFLDDRIRSNEMWSIFGPATSNEETFATVTWPWFTKNYDAIVAKIGEKSAPRLPYLGGGFCSEEGKKKVEAFFADRMQPGMERNLANTLEGIDRCILSTSRMEPAVKKLLVK